MLISPFCNNSSEAIGQSQLNPREVRDLTIFNIFVNVGKGEVAVLVPTEAVVGKASANQLNSCV